MDKQRIVKIVSDIDKYLADLGAMNIKKDGDLGDKKTFYAVRREKEIKIISKKLARAIK
ncbi:MAG: hypothetical protein AABX14_01150 [Candidatus Aenigmatarchaeota archaeon]